MGVEPRAAGGAVAGAGFAPGIDVGGTDARPGSRDVDAAPRGLPAEGDCRAGAADRPGALVDGADVAGGTARVPGDAPRALSPERAGANALRPGGTYAEAGRGVLALPGFTIGTCAAPGRSTFGAVASTGAPVNWPGFAGTRDSDTRREPVKAAAGTAVTAFGRSACTKRAGGGLRHTRSSARTA